jgi:hypothetical protein
MRGQPYYSKRAGGGALGTEAAETSSNARVSMGSGSEADSNARQTPQPARFVSFSDQQPQAPSLQPSNRDLAASSGSAGRQGPPPPPPRPTLVAANSIGSVGSASVNATPPDATASKQGGVGSSSKRGIARARSSVALLDAFDSLATKASSGPASPLRTMSGSSPAAAAAGTSKSTLVTGTADAAPLPMAQRGVDAVLGQRPAAE